MRPTISLCLVVKDEQLFLQECLESVRGFVDETIVVDTGSTDRTVAIAEACGARVYQQAWPGDLARAHDLPLPYASSEWILTLDGDEVLDPDTRELEALLQDPTLDGVRVTVRNYVYIPGFRPRSCDAADPLTHGASFWTPSANVRLFRNRPAYRHSGRLHQSVFPAMREAGARVAPTTVPIHHYGFLRTDRRKASLYRALAEEQIRDAPGDPKAHLELGIILLGRARLPEALAVFTEARIRAPLPECDFFVGVALMAMERPAEALDPLRRAAEGAASMEHFAEAADVWQALGQLYLDLDDDERAERAFRACLAARPESPDAECNLVALLARQPDVDRASLAASEVTRRYPGLALAWEVAGYQSLLAGHPEAADGHFRRALDIEPERLSSQYDLAIALARQGDEPEAAAVLARAEELDHRGWLARQLGRSPAPATRAIDVSPLGPGGVLMFIAHLSGGAAYVVFELARALARDHPQMVATLAAGSFTGEAHRQQLAELGIPVVTVGSAEQMQALQAAMRPEVVIHHWWDDLTVGTLERVGRERLVLRGTSPRPMPPGYDRYVTLSRFQAQYQAHVPPDRLELIPNGVDLDRFGNAAPRHDLWEHAGATDGRVRVVMVSRLDAGKFARRLADWLAPLERLPLVVAIAGRGSVRWQIEPELRQRGLDDWVRFLGAVPQADVPGLLAGADIGLHLTETHQESHSLAVLQMMAAGLPIVAQPRGCLPELIDDHATGYLVSREAEGAAALRRLVEDPGLRGRMGRAARAKAEAFGTESFAARWRALVGSLRAS